MRRVSAAARSPFRVLRRRVRNSSAADYVERLKRVYLGARAPGYLDRHRAGNTPIRDDLGRYRDLFDGAAETIEGILRPYRREWRWSMATLYNRWFEAVDAELYYSIVRSYRPRVVVEIGSGHSTWFAFDAIRRNDRGRIVCIDPAPRTGLPRGVEHLRSPIEDVDARVFADLAADDILFIDSSHTTEEARFHVEEVLPKLAGGVLCHHHDFTFPWAVYPGGDRAAFGETDVLLEFYRTNRGRFEILTSSAFVRYAEPEVLPRLVRSYRRLPDRIPVSLWTRKAAEGPLAG